MSSGLRIVSLAPSATAILTAVGAESDLVAATVHCEFDGPAVGGWLNPEYDRIEALDPDLVCTADALQADVRDELRDRGYRVHHADPRTLDEVLDSFESLAVAAGRAEAGRRLVERSRDRLTEIRAHVRSSIADAEHPTVYCEEWSDPPMAAGNWVPDAVAAAGGRYPFVEAGERSREIDRETVVRADPDHVVLHICGRGDRVDPDTVRKRDWNLDATVHVVDDSLLNQPSPRLLDGIETLAELLID